MPESFFGYSVTRKYPYPWFTWVTVLGGLAATAILSVVNLAANGYEPSIVFSTNPNETEFPKHPRWFEKKPWSQAAKVSSKCQDQTLTVGSQFYTNNLVFRYTIISLHRDESRPAASCTYHNDFLHDCHVSSILFSTASNTVGTRSLGTQPFDASVTVDCTLYEDSQPVIVTLDVSVSIHDVADQDTITDSTGVPIISSTDTTLHTSIYWGQKMITLHNDFYDILLHAQRIKPIQSYQYQLRPATETFNFTKAAVLIELDKDNSSSLWGLGESSLYDHTLPCRNDVWVSTYGTDLLSLRGIWSQSPSTGNSTWANDTSDPRVMKALVFDGLAKSMYFTVLSDLGQAASVNALASPQSTMEFYQKGLRMGQKIAYGAKDTTHPPTKVDDFYKHMQVAAPSVEPATISMQYLCQVPKLKSTGSLLVSIIVADVVFLQVLWVILNWLTTWFVERRDPEATYCSGCARATTVKAYDEDTEMHVITDVSTANADSLTPARSSSIDRRAYEPVPSIISRTSTMISRPYRDDVDTVRD